MVVMVVSSQRGWVAYLIDYIAIHANTRHRAQEMFDL
jgi:hypothetical protein